MDKVHGAAGDTREREGSTQVLTFALGDEVFAIEIGSVREIIQVGAMTAMPLMPDFVRGVINLRGAVVPVIDLQARFGRGAAALTKKSCIVIFDGSSRQGPRDAEQGEIGLLVDAVSEVVDLEADAIEPAPSFGTSVQREFIRGFGRRPDGFVTWLDPSRAFDIDEMARQCAGAPRLQPALAA